jgi:CubicO group peptidase (beta-lactamase class C family)
MRPLAQTCRTTSVLLLLVAFVASALGNTPTETSPLSPTDIDFSELDKLVPTELKERNTPGAVIEIVMGDRVVYQKAFGVANVETNAPMQTDMLFRLGSTIKMMTAAALTTRMA